MQKEKQRGGTPELSKGCRKKCEGRGKCRKNKDADKKGRDAEKKLDMQIKDGDAWMQGEKKGMDAGDQGTIQLDFFLICLNQFITSEYQ